LSTTTSTPPSAPAEAAAHVPDRPPSPANRLGSHWYNYARALFGLPPQRRLARASLQISRIRYWQKEFSKLSDAEVKVKGLQLRGRARGGESLDRLLPETFGLVCVAAGRTIGMVPFDVQLAAGYVLHKGALAELATGEGKTLSAVAPAALNAMMGKGVHVTTVNDYLARRDAEWMGVVYKALGLTVGVLQQQMSDDDRKQAYKCDLTYGTASEFGFDFLRDRLKVSGDKGQSTPFWTPWTSQNGQFAQPLDPRVQRGHHYALVDEADNIFIDEARTPMIIAGATSLAPPEEQVVYHWADKLAQQMERDKHFHLDEKKQKIELLEDGKTLARYSNPPIGEHSHAMDKLHEHIERALHAHCRFRRDHHYMVDDEKKVVIIDESTGRPQPNRHWRDGLHQAVEAKEGVPIHRASDHAAQVTYQSYFRLYKKLAGMTGTAMQNFWELLRVYKLWVVCVPTNRPIRRQDMPDRIFPNEDAKFDAIVEEVSQLSKRGRPVLIGTRSVDKSEKLSKRLKAIGVSHQVLNARPEHIEREADIVAQAGRPANVTIATNMAGRGTDIILGGNAETIAWSRLKHKYQLKSDVPEAEWKAVHDEVEAQEKTRIFGREVAAAGGLHVIGTERHEARRVDRQLAGRAGRQGDPGSSQFYLALDDELLEGLGAPRQTAMKKRGEAGGEGDWDTNRPVFYVAQRRIERRHFRQRVDLMVHEKNRQEILKDLGADPYVD
jgi:preprotein translocase subunit SecA